MNIKKVVTENRCMRCGMCFSICPCDAISMRFNSQSGFYDPIVSDSACIDCGKCVACCPAEMDNNTDTLIGSYKAIYLAHAQNKRIRTQSTSGGIINTLVRGLIKNDIVDGVLMTGYADNSPVETDAMMITHDNIHLVSDRPRDFASRYVSFPVLSRLKGIPVTMKRIAVVGTPCQISALTCHLQRRRNLDIFKIGIACSGAMSYNATEQYKQLQKKPDAAFYYRGSGWPGKNSLVKDGNSLSYPHLGSLFERMFSSQIFKNPGCRYCKDQFSEAADFSACDFWNRQERKTENLGNTCCIIRSKRASDIFLNLVDSGDIEIVRDLSEQETVQSQINVLKAKKGDLRQKGMYHLFITIISFIFKKRLYIGFNLKIYKMFCSWYRKMCKRSELFVKKG